MRFLPLAVLSTGVSGALLLTTAGCGGTASAPSSTGASAAVNASSSASAGSPANSGSAAGGTGSSSNSGSASAPSSPSPSPSPSAAGTIISNIEQMSGWDSCDTCSAGGAIAYSMTQGLNSPAPSTTQFSLGQGAPWAHALWWKRLGNDPTPSHFVLTLDQYMDDPGASFGIEYEANQLLDGEFYDFAVQCSFGYGIWQVWDPSNQHWVPTSVPCTRPALSTHTQIRLEFQRSNGQVIFVSIGTDGNIASLNMAFNPQPMSGLSGDFGVHIQLNADANPDPYSVWVHGMTLNYW